MLLEQEMDHDTILEHTSDDLLKEMRHFVSMGFYDLAADKAKEVGDTEKEEAYRRAHKTIISQY